MSFKLFDRNLSDEAHEKIKELGPSGIEALAFTPSGGWVIVSAGGMFARGIPDECYDKLKAYRQDGHKIRVIAFPPAGGNSWLIVTDQTLFARNISDECYQKLLEFWGKGWKPTCVAFPPAGGNSWIILAGKHLFARSINDECYQKLANFSQGLRPASQVGFTPDGGWVILAKDRVFARNIPDECYSKMGDFRTDGYFVDHVVFAPSGGWSVSSNTLKTNQPADLLRGMEEQIIKIGTDWKSIGERMATYKIPGVSVAVVLNNKLAWACTYGLIEKGKTDYVHTDTVFQAASVSKPISAIGFHKMAIDAGIGLDENVNPHLGWTLPRRDCTQTSWKNKVTLRRLLTHMGGIIGRGATYPIDACSNFDTGGGGFGGYVNKSGVGVPTLGEILAGISARSGVTVNSPRIEIAYEPGTATPYSGHGYMVMMKILENKTSKTFANWMKTNILNPMGMTRSTFALTAPVNSGPPAAGHNKDGNVLEGKRYRYPESPAAGLYTTPSDLCRAIILLNQGGTIDGKTILDATTCDIMRKNGIGIPVANAGQPNWVYRHGGDNRGFKCGFWGYPNQKSGIVVMTNGDQGGDLQTEIHDAAARIYGW